MTMPNPKKKTGRTLAILGVAILVLAAAGTAGGYAVQQRKKIITVQTEKVGAMISRVRENGLAVLVVSHDLPQVLELCDRVVVLRHGTDVASVEAGSTSVRDLVDLMSGAAGSAGELR